MARPRVGTLNPKLATLIVGGLEEGVHAAADFLYQAMYQRLSVVGFLDPPPGDDYVASRAGEPPRMKTGAGVRSLGVEKLKDAARVGFGSLGTAIAYENYMSAMDMPGGVRKGGQRPSLSLWEEYQDKMDEIIMGVWKAKSGMT